MKYGREFYLKADVEYEKSPAPQSVDVRRVVGLDPNVKNLFGVGPRASSASSTCPTLRGTTSAWRDSTRCSPRSSKGALDAHSRVNIVRSKSVWDYATTTTGR